MADQPALLRSELEGAELPFRREVARRLDAIGTRGSVGWTFPLTLAADGAASSTTIASDLVTSTCEVSFQPVTPEAAALLGKVWVPASGLVPAINGVAVGSVTVEHPPLDVGVDATYQISIKG